MKWYRGWVLCGDGGVWLVGEKSGVLFGLWRGEICRFVSDIRDCGIALRVVACYYRCMTESSTFTHVEPPDDTYGITHWSVTGDLRAPGTGYDDEANYDARDALEGTYPKVQFDPESACFYAYCHTESEATALATAIDRWVTERRGPTPEPEVLCDEPRTTFTSIGVSVQGPDPLIVPLDEYGDRRSVNLGQIVGREPDYGIERVLSFTPREDGLGVREECDEYFGFTLTADELKALTRWLLTRYAHLTAQETTNG